MTQLFQKEDISYLPKPNRLEFHLDLDLSPLDSTSTGFMIPLLSDGSVVMAQNRRRGLEFPGGHIEPGETSTSAAHRECVEETGYWVSHIKALGYLKQICEGEKPHDYTYPWPVSYQQFFVADVLSFKTYEENDECLSPVIVTPGEAEAKLNPSQYEIYKAALIRHKNWLTLP